MSVFGKYADFYDLLYQDKDYAAEAKYVHGLIGKYFPAANTVLELGCGTGRNAELMAELGYDVHGVDLSEDMLKIAEERRTKLPDELAVKLAFFKGDVCALKMEQRFDAVVSLFHVASYQTSNNALMDMFETAARHLEPGGLFVFDFWYGPAVLTDRPGVRIKRVENDKFKVVRITEPVMHPNDNVVDVNFQLIVTDKVTNKSEELHEKHKMRYLFLPEIEMMLNQTGFEIKENCEWMSESEEALGFGSWYGVCVAKKK